jgi:hypothetical protein
MKSWLLAILVFVGLVIGRLLVKMAFFPIVVAEQSINMVQGVDVKVLDSDNAIANYEWFKTQEESIIALYSKEVRAKQAVNDFKSLLSEDRNNWTREDKTEYDRLSSIVVGLGNQVDDAIALYNARSKMVNRAIFKDNLPTNLNRAFFEALTLTK